MICGSCERGELHEKVITRKFERDGYILSVPNYKVSECDCCGAIVTSAQQASENRRAKNIEEVKHAKLLRASRQDTIPEGEGK